jgi:hypothetical protein
MRIEMPQPFDADRVEAVIQRAEAEPSLELATGSLEIGDLLGEGRLLQLLATRRRAGLPLVCRLARDLPELSESPGHESWQALRASLTALILVEAASKFLDSRGNDRRVEMLEVIEGSLTSQGGEFGFGKERSIVSLDRPAAPPTFRPFLHEGDHFDRTGRRIGELRAALNLEEIDPRSQEAITTFAGELLENTLDHARYDLQGEPVGGLRFIQLRRHAITKQRGMDRLAVSEGRIRDYLLRLADDDVRGSGDASQFVELTVADCGIGFPARLLGSEEIYEGPIAAEVELALKAMDPGESSKPKSVPGRGQGLRNALDAAAELRGLVVFRAGRLALIRDATVEPPPGQDGWQVDVLPYVSGTAVSLLLPWWRAAQHQIADPDS